jgi:hypothetical protein
MNVVDIIRKAAPLNAEKVAALAARDDFRQNRITVLKIMWVAKMLNLSYVRTKKPLTFDSY